MYWATMINNAKTMHDILSVQQWMSDMENTVQKVQEMENVVGPSKPPPNNKAHDSNKDGTAIKISSTPTFGLDENNNDEVQQPLPSDDFIIVLDDEESSGSQYPLLSLNRIRKRS